ncbi:thioredoxin family protein [Aliidiomarina sedimenti]|uniref:Thioredoxin family protein n=1 Tax=Aliidiomarina sedimenti TaxID=1933879 RepID=A0ABY0C2H9_9GAMM|nr:glutaredoxin family protein [Aliidiomarina sedimenti]RUO31787.1 thioredoxin family protein [Aliidiomarina sedimenti]
MPEFYLLTRHPCPLCQQALLMIHQTELEEPVSLHMIDIDEQPELQDEYGWLIPVLIRQRDDAELKWPFDPQRLAEFLQQ